MPRSTTLASHTASSLSVLGRPGVPATVATTTAQYLTTWLASRRGLADKTTRGYADHIRLYLIPHLGNVPIQQLDTRHIEAMFTALERRNADIRKAKASKDSSDHQTSMRSASSDHERQRVALDFRTFVTMRSPVGVVA
jgi:hypothetical protein